MGNRYGANFTPITTVSIPIEVSSVVAANLTKMAAARSQTRGRYATDLFLAAYAARCKPTGDAELDAAVRGGAEPSSADQRVTALKNALDALRENYRAKEAELEAARKAAAAPSPEVLELRRKLVEIGKAVSEAESRHKKELADLQKRHEAHEQKLVEARKSELDGEKGKAATAKEMMILRQSNQALKRHNDELRAKLAAAEPSAPSASAEELVAARSAAERALYDLTLLNTEQAELREKLATAETTERLLKERISEHQAARLALAKELQAAQDALEALRAANVPAPTPEAATEPPRGIYAELDRVWAAIDELRAKFSAPAPKPAQPSPQAEADALSGTAVKTIKRFRAAGQSSAAIAKFMGVSEGAIKIILGLAPSKVQQEMAAAKAKVGAR